MEKIEKFLKFFTSFIIEVVNLVFFAVFFIPVAIICWYLVGIRNTYELLFGKDLERFLRLDAFTKKYMEKDDVLFNEHYLNCALIKDLIIFKRLSLVPLIIILTIVIVF